MQYFIPSDYLTEYYLDVSNENTAILTFFVKVAKRLKGLLRHLEIGCGPTIYQIISLTPYLKEIVYTDAYQESLDEVRKWLNGSSHAFNWENFIEAALNLESGKKITRQEISRREKEMKDKIKGLEILDASDEKALRSFLQQHGPFGSISSVFSLEVIAKTHKHLQNISRIIFRQLPHHGTFSIVMVEDGDQYKVGSKYLPNLKIDRHQLKEILNGAGFQEQKMTTTFVSSDRLNEGYKGVMLFSCTK